MHRRSGSFLLAFGRWKQLRKGQGHGQAALSCAPKVRAGRRGRTICQMCLEMKEGVPRIPQLVCPWGERPLTQRRASCSCAFHGSPCLNARLQNHDPHMIQSQGCLSLPTRKLILVQRERDEWRACSFPMCWLWPSAEMRVSLPNPDSKDN